MTDDRRPPERPEGAEGSAPTDRDPSTKGPPPERDPHTSGPHAPDTHRREGIEGRPHAEPGPAEPADPARHPADPWREPYDPARDPVRQRPPSAAGPSMMAIAIAIVLVVALVLGLWWFAQREDVVVPPATEEVELEIEAPAGPRVQPEPPPVQEPVQPEETPPPQEPAQPEESPPPNATVP